MDLSEDWQLMNLMILQFLMTLRLLAYFVLYQAEDNSTKENHREDYTDYDSCSPSSIIEKSTTGLPSVWSAAVRPIICLVFHRTDEFSIVVYGSITYILVIVANSWVPFRIRIKTSSPSVIRCAEHCS